MFTFFAIFFHVQQFTNSLDFDVYVKQRLQSLLNCLLLVRCKQYIVKMVVYLLSFCREESPEISAFKQIMFTWALRTQIFVTIFRLSSKIYSKEVLNTKSFPTLDLHHWVLLFLFTALYFYPNSNSTHIFCTFNDMRDFLSKKDFNLRTTIDMVFVWNIMYFNNNVKQQNTINKVHIPLISTEYITREMSFGPSKVRQLFG